MLLCNTRAATQTAQVRQSHRGLLWLASVSAAALHLVQLPGPVYSQGTNLNQPDNPEPLQAGIRTADTRSPYICGGAALQLQVSLLSALVGQLCEDRQRKIPERLHCRHKHSLVWAVCTLDGGSV